MTTQGQSVTFLAEFFQYGGGPAVDVTGLTIELVTTVTGSVVFGPTSSGVVHLSTGNYSYTWVVPTGQAPGSYIII